MSLLCSDKTGTLTQNKMTVRNVITSTGLISIEEFSYSSEVEYVDIVSRMAVLCNQATMSAVDTDDQMSVGGVSTTPPNSDPGHGIDVELGGTTAVAPRRRTYSTTEPPKMEAVGSNGNHPSYSLSLIDTLEIAHSFAVGNVQHNFTQLTAPNHICILILPVARPQFTVPCLRQS